MLSDADRSVPESEAARVLHEIGYEVRAGVRAVSTAESLEFAFQAAELELWGEAEFWARRGVTAGDRDGAVRAQTVLINAVRRQQRAGDAADEASRIPEGLAAASPQARFLLHLYAGFALHDAERDLAALDRFDRAAEDLVAVDSVLEAALDHGRGTAYLSLGRAEEGLAVLKRALPNLPDGDRGVALLNTGNALRQLGRYAEAQSSYDEAWSAAEGQLLVQGAILSNSAEVRFALGDHYGARRRFTEAAELRGRAGDRIGQAHTLWRLALVDGVARDVHAALGHLDESINLRRDAGLPDDPKDAEYRARLLTASAEIAESPSAAGRNLLVRLNAARSLPDMATALAGASSATVAEALALVRATAPAHNLTHFLMLVMTDGPEAALDDQRTLQEEYEQRVTAVRALAILPTWLERKRYYTSHLSAFEHPFMPSTLAAMRKHSATSGLSIAAVDAVRELLADVGQRGVDAAFAALPPFDQYDLIMRFVTVGTWAETRGLLRAHRAYYLDPATDELLTDLIDRTTDPVRVQYHRDLLRRCRRVGEDLAFAGTKREGGPSGRKLFIQSRQIDGGSHDDGTVESARALVRAIDQTGALQVMAASRHLLARQLMAEAPIGAETARQAIEVLDEALPMVTAATQPQTHAMLLDDLGQALLALSDADPEATGGALRRARHTYASLLELVPADTDPARRWRAAYGLKRAADGLRSRTELPGDRAALDREIYSACAAAMDAADALMFTGELTAIEDEVTTAQWAYIAAIGACLQQDRPRSALLAAERGRGRAFLAQAGTLDRLPDYVPAELGRREAAARSALREARAAQATSQGTGGTTAVMDAENDLRAVYRAFDAISPELARLRSGAAPSPDELTALIERLGPGVLVLAWFTAPDVTYAFAIAKGIDRILAQARPVDRQTLDGLVALADADLWRRPERPDQPISASWRGTLDGLLPDGWAGLTDEITAIMLVPHGPLHELPLHVLPVDALGGRCLLDVAEVRYAPSVTLAGRIGGRVPTGRTAVVVVQPDPDDAEFATEAEQVAAGLLDSVLLTTGAGAVARHAPDAAILHIAAHGTFVSDNPLASRMDLEPEPLTARFVLEYVRLPGTTVVLSGCETARHQIGSADDSEGLTRAFLAAGAGAVIAGQWRVDSAATRDLMARFYRSLGGSTAAAAMRRAALELQAEPAYKHPYYWAPFIVTGG